MQALLPELLPREPVDDWVGHGADVRGIVGQLQEEPLHAGHHLSVHVVNVEQGQHGQVWHVTDGEDNGNHHEYPEGVLGYAVAGLAGRYLPLLDRARRLFGQVFFSLRATVAFDRGGNTLAEGQVYVSECSRYVDVIGHRDEQDNHKGYSQQTGQNGLNGAVVIFLGDPAYDHPDHLVSVLKLYPLGGVHHQGGQADESKQGTRT